MRQRRKTHTKSKTGCGPCRERHVKCDEQGPPCVNCTVRNLPCSYLTPRSGYGVSKRLAYPHDTDSLLVRSSSNESTPQPTRAIPGVHDVIELELLHRWTMITSHSVSCNPIEHHWMQFSLPQQAFRHHFILYNMLSTAALDIIASSKDGADTAPYYQAALKYFNKSSALMRQELSNARGEETTHLLFLNATFTVYNHIAISQHLMTDGATQAPPLSAIQRACLLFEMCLGASYVMNLNPTALEKSLAYLPSLHEQWSSLPLDHLREEDRYGLSLLDSIKDAIFFGDANESKDTAITRDMYDGSMKRMRLCYSHDLHRVAQGFCMSFPKYSGSDLAKAAKAHDPMALLLIMYWGVLLHRLAADVWWIGPLGQHLVQEGEEIVSRSKLVHVPATLEAVMWTRLQTGNLD